MLGLWNALVEDEVDEEFGREGGAGFILWRRANGCGDRGWYVSE